MCVVVCVAVCFEVFFDVVFDMLFEVIFEIICEVFFDIVFDVSFAVVLLKLSVRWSLGGVCGSFVVLSVAVVWPVIVGRGLVASGGFAHSGQ